MKIGFDISQLAFSGGVVTYTKNLAEQLSKYSDLEMVFYYASLRKKYLGNLKNVKNYPLPPTLLELIFNQIHLLPIEILIGKVDIFHSSDWIQPPTRAKKITTYHDVVPLKYPQWSNPKIVTVHKKRLELVEKEIDMVIAVSENTKNDLLEVSKIPASKITVIYEAASKQFQTLDKKLVEDFRQKYHLPEQFILAMGGVGERKNLFRIKEAAKTWNLVITGVDIPWIDEVELPLLYNAATVLFYPSLYEGFGLPILEAMACGTPIITSNLSSMPEIGGKAACYVNPQNVDDMTKKLKTVMSDQDARKELAKKGLSRAKQFSWEKCAQETVAVYKSLLK